MSVFLANLHVYYLSMEHQPFSYDVYEPFYSKAKIQWGTCFCSLWKMPHLCETANIRVVVSLDARGQDFYVCTVSYTYVRYPARPHLTYRFYAN